MNDRLALDLSWQQKDTVIGVCGAGYTLAGYNTHVNLTALVEL